MKNSTKQARFLRLNQTKAEQILWDLLKNRQINGVKFRRQSPIGKYIVDFVSRENKIVIELDGGQHNETENIIYDQKRTEFLNSQGYTVIRFWNNEIENNLEGVYDKLLEILSH